MGVVYLITFGSIVAFTAYTWLLDHASPTLVSTHTYANPIIAVLLGWLWAGEFISVRVLEAGLLDAVCRVLDQPRHGKAGAGAGAG